MKRLLLTLALCLGASAAAAQICNQTTTLKFTKSTGKICQGGPQDGNACTTQAFCAPGTCEYTCVGGANDGTVCTSPAQCASPGTCGLSLTWDEADDNFRNVDDLCALDPILETELDDEAELEGQLTDVIDVFTDNDGALDDDDLTDDQIGTLTDVSEAGAAIGEALVSDGAGAWAASAATVCLSTDVNCPSDEVGVASVADGTGVDGTAGEGGTYTPGLDLTEVNDTVFGDNTDASITHAVDPTGTTNPTWTYTDGNVNLSTGNLQEAGIDVATGSHFSPTAGISTDHGAGAVAATTDLAAALCGTGEVLEDQGGSWACITTPTGTFSSFDVTDTDASPILTVDDGEQVQFIGAGEVTIAAAADGSNHDVTITGSAHFSPNADPGVDHSSYVAGHGDGANCTTGGEWPAGVDAAGAVQGCASVLPGNASPTTDGQITWDSTAESLKVGDDGAATLEFVSGAHFSPTAGIDTDHGAGAVDATTDFAAALCGTNEILEDSGGSWACISTPTGGSPAGADQQVQVNQLGAFAGAAGLTYDDDGTSYVTTVSGSATQATDILSLTKSGATQPSMILQADGDVLFPDSDVNNNQNICIGNLCSTTSVTTTDPGLAIGRNTVASGDGAMALGYHADAGPDTISIGTSAGQAGSDRRVVIGSQAGGDAPADNSVVIGYDAENSGTLSTVIGYLAGSTGASVVSIGANSDCDHLESVCIGTDATSTAAQQLVIGGQADEITNAYIGNGVVATTPQATTTIQTTGGSGTDKTGSTLKLAGGRGTGAGEGGDLVFEGSQAGGSGSTLRPLAELIRFDAETGNIIWGGVPGDDFNLTISVTDLTAARALDFPDDSLADDDVVMGDGAGSLAYVNIPDCNTEQMLTYTASTNTWGCEADDGAGGGTTIQVDGSGGEATMNIVSADSTGIDINLDTVSSPDEIEINLDPTEVGSVTWLDNADRTWTFDIAAAGTNPTLAFSASVVEADAHVVVDDSQDLRLKEGDGGGENYLALSAPATVTSNQTCTFEDDANFIPDSCVGDGTDGIGTDTLDDLSDDLPTALSNVTTISDGDYCQGNAGGGFDCDVTTLPDADVDNNITIDHSAAGTLTLDQTVAPTTEGVMAWDATNDEIEIGETTTTAIFKQTGTFNDEQFCTAETTGNQIDCDTAGSLADDDLSDDLITALSGVTTVTDGSYCQGGAGSSMDCDVTQANIPAADHIDAIGEIDAAIKMDDTDTDLATTSVAAPAGNECVEMDSSGSLVLAGDTCANLGPGGSTAIDDLADAGAGDDAVGLTEQGQVWTWDTATTAAAFDGLTLRLLHDATTDTLDQELLVLERPDEATDAADEVESLLRIENLDTVDPVNDAIIIRSAAGLITDAIDANDAQITNIITHAGGSVTSSDLDIIDDGGIESADITDSTVDQPDVDDDATLAGNPGWPAESAWFATTGIIFEGDADDAFEGLLTANMSASDKTWTLPNFSGLLLIEQDAEPADNPVLGPKRCSFTLGNTGNGGILCEGATDDFETIVRFTPPTVDREITVPDAAGEVSLLGQSIASAEIEADTIVADDVDPSLDTRSTQIIWEDPADTDEFVVKLPPVTGTMTRVDCETVGATSMTISICDGEDVGDDTCGTDILSPATLVCTDAGANDTSLSATGFVARDDVTIVLTAVSGTPTQGIVYITSTVD